MMGILLASVASVSLLVGGIGIMNIMLVSVTERTREIGIRMAVGAKNRHILTQFLLEAVVLSTAGGFLGVVCGIVGAKLVSALAGWPTLLSAEIILVAVMFSSAVGIFFGFYPARRAAHLDPIQALRYE
jgi:putative ABC transport system permease protein